MSYRKIVLNIKKDVKDREDIMLKAERPVKKFIPPNIREDPVLEEAYEEGFKKGYNRAMPKPHRHLISHTRGYFKGIRMRRFVDKHTPPF